MATAFALTANAQEPDTLELLLHAKRIFDGSNMQTDASVLISNGKVVRIAKKEDFSTSNAKTIDLGDATILPGFIDLHTHSSFQQIPEDIILKHGVTTVRDVGGPVHQPYGGDGNLRVLTSGPIITAPNGYPIPSMGEANIAKAVATEEEARKTVRNLIESGASIIKVALEPGGETGAPWSSSHGHNPHNPAKQSHAEAHHKSTHIDSHSQTAWPLLSQNIVDAIVDEAHKLNRKVTAHLAEEKGAQLAINAGIDEWAHAPCHPIREALLKKAAKLNVKVVTTLDTLSKCSGVAHNVSILSAFGTEFLYGAEIAHPDIPWGIDAQELMLMMHTAKMSPLEVLRSATSKAGQYLNIPLLGTLQPDAPADVIAVKGDPLHAFKRLEYPDLVISGGKIITNNF